MVFEIEVDTCNFVDTCKYVYASKYFFTSSLCPTVQATTKTFLDHSSKYPHKYIHT